MDIAIFVSGRGSNMEAIINAAKNNEINARVALVISNNPDAFAVQTAKKMGIEVCVINNKFYPEREKFDDILLYTLGLYKIDLICLAGFMRLLTKKFLDNCNCPVINIHPSLLPNFKGAHAIEDAYNARVKTTGCTVHHVIEEMDSGNIIVQKPIDIDYTVGIESLKRKIHIYEHMAYIEAINIVLKEISLK